MRAIVREEFLGNGEGDGVKSPPKVRMVLLCHPPLWERRAPKERSHSRRMKCESEYRVSGNGYKITFENQGGFFCHPPFGKPSFGLQSEAFLPDEE